jgi:predicted O-methyltransferase YrrM
VSELASPSELTFSTDDFSEFAQTWSALLAQFRPRRILEIGSYEGRSTCFIIAEATTFGSVDLHCMDTFGGSEEHRISKLDLSDLERRFDRNTAIALEQLDPDRHCTLTKHKTDSFHGLAKLIATGFAGSFDMIYVDGSHLAHDVLKDMVLSFELLRVGGLLIADDYLWYERTRRTRHLTQVTHPKPAVDAFVNVNHFRLKLLQAPLYQLYLQRTA